VAWSEPNRDNLNVRTKMKLLRTF